MRRSPALPLAMLVVVALATAWGFAAVLSERYSTGASYPVYSSLRSDPLGAKALFQSLDALPEVETVRNYRKLEKLEGGPGRTLLLLHVSPQQIWNGEQINGEVLKGYAAAGGRVIVAIDGQAAGWTRMMEEADKKRDENAKERLKKKLQEEEEKEKARGKDSQKEDARETDDKASKEKPGEGGKSPEETFIAEALFKSSKSLAKVLGFTMEPGKFVLLPRGGYKLTPDKALPLPEEALPLWYSKSSLVLDKDSRGKWQVLATVKDQITLAEQRVGRGSIVIATDSYFASNEGLWKEPEGAFLAWLTGDARTVVFDETHLGTLENPGIMTLARRYRLHGMFIGGMVLFALFVWKSSSSLLPQRENDHATSNVVAGQGAAAALVSLLKRGVPRAQLLQKGLDAWERHHLNLSPAQKKRLAEARSLLPTSPRLRQGVLVETYRHIGAVLYPKSR